MGLFRKLRDTFRPGRIDSHLDDEFQFHLEQRIADLMAQGATEAGARREAARMFGNRAHLADSTRDRDVLGWLQSILQDVRFAARNLRRSPTFAAVAVLSLAFGIGVNAAIFTLVDGILLEKLPLPDADRIVEVHAKYQGFENSAFNVPILREIQRQHDILSEAAGFYANEIRFNAGGDQLNARVEFVTGGFFRFFRAHPAIGRLLDEDDAATEGAHPVCVLSFEAWQNVFGGDPGALRRTLKARDRELQIVGVAPPGFVGGELQNRYDVYVPISETHALVSIPAEASNYSYLSILGRLPPGMPRQAASAHLTAASRAIDEALPKSHVNPGGTFELLDASRGYDSWRSSLRDPLMVLMGAVSLVLLVACANLANLLLARAAERRQEFAIKLAIGISRWRLMRQLLVETALLSAAGGTLALLAGAALTRWLLSIFNAGNGAWGLNVSPNGAVLWFTFGACLLTVLLAGLYPAWKSARTDPAPGLQASWIAGRHSFVRRGLILVQVALAVVLMFGASLFSHSLRKLQTIDLGYRIDHVLSVSVGIDSSYANRKGVLGSPVLRGVLDRASHLPGVESAAMSTPGVLTGVMMRDTMTLSDGDATGRKMNNTGVVVGSSNLFATLRMRLLEGRDFSAADSPAAPPVAIVNRSFAAKAWPGQSAIGRHFDGWQLKGVQTIGVVADSRDHNIRDDAAPMVYFAFQQQEETWVALEMRVRGSLPAVEAAVRRIVKSDAPGYEVARASSMEMMRDRQISQERLLAFLSSLFGALGTTLALVGIYGLIAYSVMRRTREIGIRISVGAQGRDVLWLFLREASLLLAAGLAIGLPLALLLARFVGKLLYHVPALDGVSVAATAALVAIGGVAASLIPARRAARVDPLSALRAE